MVVAFTVQEGAGKQSRVVRSYGLTETFTQINAAQRPGGLMSSGSRKGTVTGS